jgi:hypothetical protein
MQVAAVAGFYGGAADGIADDLAVAGPCGEVDVFLMADQDGPAEVFGEIDRRALQPSGEINHPVAVFAPEGEIDVREIQAGLICERSGQQCSLIQIELHRAGEFSVKISDPACLEFFHAAAIGHVDGGGVGGIQIAHGHLVIVGSGEEGCSVEELRMFGQVGDVADAFVGSAAELDGLGPSRLM